MKQQALLIRLRDDLAAFVAQTDGNSAMTLTDHNRIAEHLVCGLMRHILGFRNLRNLNATDRVNFPAIDLADYPERVAVQVTATASLEKIRNTIDAFLRHGLNAHFDRLIVYVLSRKNRSYSQTSINKTLTPGFVFDVRSDILDFTDLLRDASSLEPARLAAAVHVIETFNRGAQSSPAEEEFDPPAQSENTTLNLVEFYFPETLYIADVLPAFLKRPRELKRTDGRTILRHHGKALARTLPSDFLVHSGQLLTFHDLTSDEHPFSWAVDEGTIVDLTSREFIEADSTQERLFKSLLRYAIQVKLFHHRVLWRHEVKLFAFMPHNPEDPFRDIVWQGAKRNQRRVYERVMNKRVRDKVLIQKHFAFGVDFYHMNSRWFASLTPDWYFSYGPDFGPSRFASGNISWLKRHENNSSVHQHFRFLVAWLRDLDSDDLFAQRHKTGSHVSIGDVVQLTGHPALTDSEWLPTQSAEATSGTGDLFADREDPA